MFDVIGYKMCSNKIIRKVFTASSVAVTRQLVSDGTALSINTRRKVALSLTQSTANLATLDLRLMVAMRTLQTLFTGFDF